MLQIVIFVINSIKCSTENHPVSPQLFPLVFPPSVETQRSDQLCSARRDQKKLPLILFSIYLFSCWARYEVYISMFTCFYPADPVCLAPPATSRPVICSYTYTHDFCFYWTIPLSRRTTALAGFVSIGLTSGWKASPAGDMPYSSSFEYAQQLVKP